MSQDASSLAAVTVLAAMEEEVAPLKASLSREPRGHDGSTATEAGSRHGRSAAVRWCGPTAVRVQVTGDGARKARSGAQSAFETATGALLVLGVAGGLDPTLRPGELVVAERVQGDGVTYAADEVLVSSALACAAALPGGVAKCGPLRTADRIAVTTGDKRRLWSELDRAGAAMVDLESVWYVAEAEARGIPWLVLRGVLDPAEEALPLDLNRFRDDGGSVRRGAVARHLALRPLLAPSLIKLQKRMNGLAEQLGDWAAAILAARVVGHTEGVRGEPGSERS